MISAGQRVFARQALSFKEGAVIFPKGKLFTVSPELVSAINANKKYFAKKYETFPGRDDPAEKAKAILGSFDKDGQAAAHHIRKRRDSYEEFSASWQYYDLVAIILWRKHCGVSFRDTRSKGRMKGKGR